MQEVNSDDCRVCRSDFVIFFRRSATSLVQDISRGTIINNEPPIELPVNYVMQNEPQRFPCKLSDGNVSSVLSNVVVVHIQKPRRRIFSSCDARIDDRKGLKNRGWSEVLLDFVVVNILVRFQHSQGAPKLLDFYMVLFVSVLTGSSHFCRKEILSSIEKIATRLTIFRYGGSRMESFYRSLILALKTENYFTSRLL